MLERLSPGWQHLPRKCLGSCKQGNTRAMKNGREVENAFQLARMTHDTCTSLPSQPLHAVAAGRV